MIVDRLRQAYVAAVKLGEESLQLKFLFERGSAPGLATPSASQARQRSTGDNPGPAQASRYDHCAPTGQTNLQPLRREV
jgi:hypothetical protein